MAKREAILDGLAWAGISEAARVARISAGLVREIGDTARSHTKTRVKEAVRDTSPPYGRGKAIYEAVEEEYRRQKPIYRARLRDHTAWERRRKFLSKLSTRINAAYAFRFGRPLYQKRQHFRGDWRDREARDAPE
jgi:hypothetical protein